MAKSNRTSAAPGMVQDQRESNNPYYQSRYGALSNPTAPIAPPGMADAAFYQNIMRRFTPNPAAFGGNDQAYRYIQAEQLASGAPFTMPQMQQSAQPAQPTQSAPREKELSAYEQWLKVLEEEDRGP